MVIFPEYLFFLCILEMFEYLFAHLYIPQKHFFDLSRNTLFIIIQNYDSTTGKNKINHIYLSSAAILNC